MTLFLCSRWKAGGPASRRLKRKADWRAAADGLSFLRLAGAGRRAAGSPSAPPSRWVRRPHVTDAGSGAAGRAEGAAAAEGGDRSREVAAWRGTGRCPLGQRRRKRKMAEASAAGAGAGAAVAAHRFFCHFCKGEVSPKLPVRALCPPRLGIHLAPEPRSPRMGSPQPGSL